MKMFLQHETYLTVTDHKVHQKSNLNLCDVLCSIKHKQSFTNKVLLSKMKVKCDPTPGLVLKVP